CHRGCITRSYFSTLNATLPAAEKTGRLTVRTHSVVHSLIFDPQSRRVSGVRVIDGQTKKALEFQSKIVFVNASTLESTRILLNSATPEFPNGLANSSGELGKNLMDHIMAGGARGTIPGFTDRIQTGRRPNGIYVPRFRNVKTKEKNFVRGYGFQGGADREGWSRGILEAGFGANFKNSLKQPGPWVMRFHGFGECLPNPPTSVEIAKDRGDAWGVPIQKIHCEWRKNEKAMQEDMATTAAEMLAAAGAKEIRPYIDHDPPGLTIHEMGTARMG